MTPEQRDKACVAIAPAIFAMEQSPLTPKGLDELKNNGTRFLTKDELKSLRCIVDKVASVLED